MNNTPPECVNASSLQQMGFGYEIDYKTILDQYGAALVDKFAIFGAVLIIAGAWHMSKYSKTEWIIDGDFNLTEFITGVIDMMAFGAGIGAFVYYFIAQGVIAL